MATKPRRLKTPLQLWIADNRKRAGLTPRDLAQMTGVTESTARGWESRGSPSQDALRALEVRFGVVAPEAEEPLGDQAALVKALMAQTEAISALVQRLDALEPVVEDWVRERLRETLRNDAAGSGAPGR